MTSSNGNIFRVTGHLCGEFTGPRWILRTKLDTYIVQIFTYINPFELGIAGPSVRRSSVVSVFAVQQRYNAIKVIRHHDWQLYLQIKNTGSIFISQIPI